MASTYIPPTYGGGTNYATLQDPDPRVEAYQAMLKQMGIDPSQIGSLYSPQGLSNYMAGAPSLDSLMANYDANVQTPTLALYNTLMSSLGPNQMRAMADSQYGTNSPASNALLQARYSPQFMQTALGDVMTGLRQQVSTEDAGWMAGYQNLLGLGTSMAQYGAYGPGSNYYASQSQTGPGSKVNYDTSGLDASNMMGGGGGGGGGTKTDPNANASQMTAAQWAAFQAFQQQQQNQQQNQGVGANGDVNGDSTNANFGQGYDSPTGIGGYYAPPPPSPASNYLGD